MTHETTRTTRSKYQRWCQRVEGRRASFERGRRLDRVTAEALFELAAFQESRLKRELSDTGRTPSDDEEKFLVACDDFRKALQEALYGTR